MAWTEGQSLAVDVFLFFLFGGVLSLMVGDTKTWFSFTTCRSCCSLFLMPLYRLVMELMLAWMDSAPCSPINPVPTPHVLINGTM